jgi:hypothetical protein
MYLVELRPGKEELYRSSDELALAIRNGDVDARSRVYHRATAKWISITLHPQYKAIVAASKEDSVPRPARRVWGILGGNDKPVESNGVESNGSDAAAPNGQLHRWRRPMALGISALLLVSGIQLAFSGPRPPWSGKNRVAVSVKSPKARPVKTESLPKELVSLASTTATWSADDEPVTHTLVGSQRAGITPVLPRAPRLRSRSLRDALVPETGTEGNESSVDGVLGRYRAAHDSARTRLEAGLRVVRLTRLFAASRLSPGGGVTDTRMSLAGAANFIRVFRQQQAAIESAYQDSVTALAKENRWPPKKIREWYSRPAQVEAPSLKLLGETLLASIDTLLGVLDTQAGAYKIRGSAIAFEDPNAGQTYGALRRKVREQMDAVIAAGGATSSGPAALLLQAIGTSTLPRET